MNRGKTNRLWVSLSVTLVLALIIGMSAPVAAGPASGPGERVPVLIGFTQQPGSTEKALVRQAGGTIKHTYHLVPAIAASISESAIQGMLNNPRVTVIEPNIEVHAIDAELNNTWGVDRIDADLVHASGNKGTGIKVAIIDSGIDYTHPDLDANYAGGFDFVNNDNDPMDDNGHGTHVAGTVAAEDNDDPASVVGVAPQAKLYALKVLSSSGSGSYSDVIAALEWAVDNGMQVTNNSYGSSGNPGSIVKAAFDNSYAAGVLHVAAAGNSGNCGGKGDNVIYPAWWESLIAVGATNNSDGSPCSSSTGPDVELAAPGVSINSTVPTGNCKLCDNSGYKLLSGTSMASPHVAGTVALVLKSPENVGDYNSDGTNETNADGVWTNVEARNVLQATAEDIGLPATWAGYGLVDAAAAAPPSVNTSPSVTIESPADGASFASGETITITGTASDVEDGDLSASLSWSSSIDGFIGSGASVSTSSLSHGAHSITASVTDSDGATGSDSITINVNGVEVSPDTQEGNGSQGSVVSYIYTIKNTGTAKDGYNLVGVSFDLGWVVRVKDAVSGEEITTIGPLMPGESRDVVLEVEIPAGSTAGDVDRQRLTAISWTDPHPTDTSYSKLLVE